MAQLEPTQLPEFVLKAIEQRLKQESDKLIFSAIEQVKKDMEYRAPEIVAGVIVDMMKLVSFEDFKERVIFTIKKV